MLIKDSSKILRGTLFTIIGGICWGFFGACGQYLFTNFGTVFAFTLYFQGVKDIGVVKATMRRHLYPIHNIFLRI